MSELVHYDLTDGVATLTMDDGKRNALNPEMLGAIDAAFDRAEADGAIVILTGRDTTFSAGFDLKVMKKGGVAAMRMLRDGFTLPARVLGHPRPVIMACNGHCYAMGVFLMLSGDFVFGCRGEFRIAANEVAIGIPVPRVAEHMLRHRLRPADFQRAAVLAETFDPEAAREAGFFDALVDPGELLDRAREKAHALAELDGESHRITKQRVRKDLIRRVRRSVPLDLSDAAMLGIKRAYRR